MKPEASSRKGSPPRRRLAGIEVAGLSIGGLNTCIDLPELGLCFDIGRCPQFAVPRSTILFTHSHVDHMAGVVAHCASRALLGMAPPRYVVPPECAEAFRDLFEVWRRLDGSDLPHELVVLAVGEDLKLRPDLVARPFRSPHRAPCQGYGLWLARKHLRSEFRGLPAEELRRLRVEDRVSIEEESLEPLVAFTGDTTIDVIERESVVRTARLLILEATFLDDRISPSEARSRGHVHLAQIAERASSFENQAILLTHFSARYRSREIPGLLDRGLPQELRARVTPLLGVE